MTASISILGGGPAGSAAAIAALREGAACSIVEKSKFPRHKVCGEFFSPEIRPELEKLDVWDDFAAAGPASIRRMRLVFGNREKIAPLPETAWGLSRYAFDELMLERARRMGAAIVREAESKPQVLARGRTLDGSPRGRRLFGFKTHFEGPAGDAVELFFFDGCYVGVAPVENGRTNICGLGPEDFLRRFEFDYDAVVRRSDALADRLGPLRRSMDWFSTGPLKYAQNFDSRDQYLAGDALSFVDPFTGSGLLAAVKTGASAGIGAARREPVARHIKRSRAALRQPFEIASLIRKTVQNGLAERMAGLVPARVLFALTRPR